MNDADKKINYENMINEIYKIKVKYLLRRENKINDYFNKIVKYMEINYKEKENIIAGYNLNWKKGVNIGKKNNRNFYNIPYSKLIKKLKDKFEEKIILTEESYTSKCDALSLEKISNKTCYNGERIKRGLYKSKNGEKINADLNGAINIMRKKIKLEKIEGEELYNPKRIKLSRNVSFDHRVKAKWNSRINVE